MPPSRTTAAAAAFDRGLFRIPGAGDDGADARLRRDPGQRQLGRRGRLLRAVRRRTPARTAANSRAALDTGLEVDPGERLADVERLAVPVEACGGRRRRTWCRAVYRPESSPLASGTRAMMPTPGRRRGRQHPVERLEPERVQDDLHAWRRPAGRSRPAPRRRSPRSRRSARSRRRRPACRARRTPASSANTAVGGQCSCTRSSRSTPRLRPGPVGPRRGSWLEGVVRRAPGPPAGPSSSRRTLPSRGSPPANGRSATRCGRRRRRRRCRRSSRRTAPPRPARPARRRRRRRPSPRPAARCRARSTRRRRPVRPRVRVCMWSPPGWWWRSGA